LVLGVALLSVLILFRDQLGRLLAEFAAGAQSMAEGMQAQSGLLVALGVGTLAVGLGAIWWLRRRSSTRTGKLGAMLASFGAGLRSLLHVRNRFGVLASTVLMWFAYAVMTYIPLQMLGLVDAYDLTLLDAWAMVSLGAIGMALPAPGGTGSYHYAIIVTMTLLLGVPETPAATYALLTHAVQLVFMVVVGFACLLAQGAGLGSLRGSEAPASDPVPVARPAPAE
ncbi:MAG: lysylphosphatidylglycerol synthase domain-containing protein, partial [Bacteroidota bacterium]